MKDKICQSIAWLLPGRLVYWCLIRVWAHGTQGQYGNTIASELTCFEAIDRWETGKVK